MSEQNRPWLKPDHPAMRKCGLCGQPIIKHIVPGEKHREWAGSLGLICPTDARLTVDTPSDKPSAGLVTTSLRWMTARC